MKRAETLGEAIEEVRTRVGVLRDVVCCELGRYWSMAKMPFQDRETNLLSNFKMHLTSRGKEELGMGIKILFAHAPGKKATYYQITEKYGLVFFWHEPTDAPRGLENEPTPLPYEYTADQAYGMAIGWLEVTNYPPEPDRDGDNEKGWTLSCDDWGYAGGSHYGFMSLKPTWAELGK